MQNGRDTAIDINLQRWQELAALPDHGWMQNLPESFQNLRDTLFAYSPYLTKLLLKKPEILKQVMQEGIDQTYDTIKCKLQNDIFQTALQADTVTLMRELRLAKAELALAAAIADIAGIWGLQEVTRSLSEFADGAIEAAVAHLLVQAHKRGEIALKNLRAPTQGSGLIVLGMGKLGALELNYSSDIDLIVFYEQEVIPYTGKQGEQRFFSRLAQDLVNIMQERTAEGYVFRTDLRLRPDPASTPPAVSVDAAMRYYESVGQNWERAAMIKARAVAGDLQVAASFMKYLTPFMWRRSLDFAAIQDILSIKRQMDHRTSNHIQVAGHNVKLGLGGIREIEFFVQLHQLIWGGREPSLRSRATLDTLATLVQLKRVTSDNAALLREAYGFLRMVEHRLQMVDDQQTHSMPVQKEQIMGIAQFCGYRDISAFEADLLRNLKGVHDIFLASFQSEALSGDEGNLVFTGVSHDPNTIATLKQMGFAKPEAISEIIMSWHHGKRRCTRTKRARELLTELVPTILKQLSQTANPDFAFMKFDEFLARLPAGVQIFSLFSSNPHLLTLVADIMGSAPMLGDTLSRYPQLLESVLFSNFFAPLPAKHELQQQLDSGLKDCTHYEARLEMLRIFKNEKQFQAGVHVLRDVTPVDKTAEFLSVLAELLIHKAYVFTLEEFQRQYGEIASSRFSIVALGKLGSEELTFGSDVDLIFLYDTPDFEELSDGEQHHTASVYYNRFSQRLINALTAIGNHGMLYEVDTRLRPSGKQGLLAVSKKAFSHYFHSSAWTFEFMALSKARVISGDESLAAELTEIIHNLLQIQRFPTVLAEDVKTMRERTEKEFPSDNKWDIKHASGGLMDIEFLAQYCVLLLASEAPSIIQRSADKALLALRDLPNSPLTCDQITCILHAHEFLTRLFNLLRLVTGGDFSEETAHTGLKNLLTHRMGFKDFSALEKKLQEVETQVRECYLDIIHNAAEGKGHS